MFERKLGKGKEEREHVLQDCLQEGKRERRQGIWRVRKTSLSRSLFCQSNRIAKGLGLSLFEPVMFISIV